ncbi:MAG: hypothetical protein WC979_05115 [Candidatus Pacearchaeota archaeon]|jgi:hypothetical protein
MASVPSYLIGDYAVSYALPFVLVFTLVFAILQKTKVLGDGAKQANAIIALVIGLFLIAFPVARDIVVNLMPFLAVFIVILLVFMLLYGFIVGKTDGDVLGKWWKIALGAILTISLVVFLLMITGFFEVVKGFLFGTTTGYQILVNGAMVLVIIGVIVAVVKGDK